MARNKLLTKRIQKILEGKELNTRQIKSRLDNYQSVREGGGKTKVSSITFTMNQVTQVLARKPCFEYVRDEYESGWRNESHRVKVWRNKNVMDGKIQTN